MVYDGIKTVMAWGDKTTQSRVNQGLSFVLRPKKERTIAKAAQDFVNEIKLERDGLPVLLSADSRIADTGAILRYSSGSRMVFIGQADVELSGSVVKSYPKEMFLFAHEEIATSMGLMPWQSVRVTTDPAFAYEIDGESTPQIDPRTNKPVEVSKFLASNLAVRHEGV